MDLNGTILSINLSKVGFTALHLAARTSNVECVESLLRNGNVDANAEDFDHRTPLHAAVG
ncbi:hypothetical protein FF38_00273 [Lucilia cuprina]|uniref:Uncharacterized protein n=1 Tax=Lucilia cuprina TaxID=7375 RepID=A0A0L0CMZ3_LUCCU|nr:hypothetical protein FF38_00273 [Lucilia cuprina]